MQSVSGNYGPFLIERGWEQAQESVDLSGLAGTRIGRLLGTPHAILSDISFNSCAACHSESCWCKGERSAACSDCELPDLLMCDAVKLPPETQPTSQGWLRITPWMKGNHLSLTEKVASFVN